jgi:hypothetical protein
MRWSALALVALAVAARGYAKVGFPVIDVAVGMLSALAIVASHWRAAC